MRRLAARLRRRGFEVEEVDIRIEPTAHDLSCPRLRAHYLRRIRNGDYDIVWIAPPCSSFSTLHEEALRSKAHPNGTPEARAEWGAYLDRHNSFAIFAAVAAQAADDAGAAWGIENPADRSVVGSPEHWPEFADRATIWDLLVMVKLRERTGAQPLTFPQCAWGGDFRKDTTILASITLIPFMAAFMGLRCDHAQHTKVAAGVDAAGESLAAQAAAYPPAMNEGLADAFDKASAANAIVRAAVGDVGAVTDGHVLGPTAREAVEVARAAPPAFGSARNRRDAGWEAMAREPMPRLYRAKPPEPKKKKQRGRPLPARAEPHEPAAGALPREPKPSGKIHISMLYNGDDGPLYHSSVLPWLVTAGAALARVLRGEPPGVVETLVITQAQMSWWARGIIWDTRDPDDCKPVAHSSADTPAGEGRQINRAALRRIAAAVGWDKIDPDLLEQLDGGCDSRSDAELLSVFSFHHQGLVENAAAVKEVVDAEREESWLSQPYPHPPFAPCRVLPRNVIFQPKYRIKPDGSVEVWHKPRITTDASDGADDSINGGVPAHSRAVELPTAQRLARGAAIVDAYGLYDFSTDSPGLKRPRSLAYCIDLEKAYRFWPMATQVLWQFVFLWVDDEGNPALLVDLRLAFGGAFAVQRFQRLGRMLVAYAVLLQTEFDSLHPLPPVARARVAARRALAAAGELPDSPEQFAPRDLQGYIDDLTGSSLDDRIEQLDVTLSFLADLEMAPLSREAFVGEVDPRSRACYHCRCVIVSARVAGFAEAEPKTQIGDPVAALGLALHIKERRLRCPAPKADVLKGIIREQLSAVSSHAPVSTELVSQLTGKLLNLAQVEPAIRPTLHGGYGLVSTGGKGRAKRLPPKLSLRPGGSRELAWKAMLETSLVALEAGVGVAIAPPLLFPARSDPGVLTSVTDASGIHGLGGWATLPEYPKHIFIVSELWPEDVQRALTAGCKGGNAKGVPTLSMPAAETFAQQAVPAALAAASVHFHATIAVGDCMPAVRAVRRGSSKTPQIREVLRCGAELTPDDVLTVHVRREFNTGADTLSHPANLAAVLEQLTALGYVPVVLPIPESLWEQLRAAIAAGCGRS